MRAAKEGMTEIETSSDSATAPQMAMAMSRKSCPVSWTMKRIGKKTAIVVRVEERTAPHTSRVPVRAASLRPRPFWRWR